MKSIIEKNNVSTNRCNTIRIKDTSQNPDIWLNELYNLSVNFKKTKYKYENMKMKWRRMCLTSYLNNTNLTSYYVTRIYPIWTTSNPKKKYVGSRGKCFAEVRNKKQNQKHGSIIKRPKVKEQKD